MGYPDLHGFSDDIKSEHDREKAAKVITYLYGASFLLFGTLYGYVLMAAYL